MSLWAHYKGKKLYSIQIGTKSEHTGDAWLRFKYFYR